MELVIAQVDNTDKLITFLTNRADKIDWFIPLALATGAVMIAAGIIWMYLDAQAARDAKKKDKRTEFGIQGAPSFEDISKLITALKDLSGGKLLIMIGFAMWLIAAALAWQLLEFPAGVLG